MNFSRLNRSLSIVSIASVIASCSSKSNGGGRGFTRDEDIVDEGSVHTEEVSEEESDFNSGCVVEDGTYSATVDYYNPETGYSETYSLDVEVESCEVVQIDFPNGGWLDSDHISPAELDDNARCTVDGEEGRTYDIQIDGY